jgi:hypothetical protein
MKKNIVFFALVISFFAISSCSNYVYFTEEIRNDLNKNKLDIEKVQYYNSDKIILRRHLTKDELELTKGTIRFENGQYFEEIIIPSKTKGIAINNSNDMLNIAFETGENRDLLFSLNDDDKYQISADNWKDDYGCVYYDTASYYIIPGSSNTVLLVSKEDISNYERKRRILKGRTVGR